MKTLFFFNSVIDSLKSGNKLIIPEVKNINQSSPATQISNNTVNQEAKNKKSGCGCSTIIVVFIVLLLIGRCGKSDSNRNSESDIPPVTTQSTEIRSQETETTEPVTTTTTKAPELSEMELLTSENHPKFYGSQESAETVWFGHIGEDSIMIKNTINSHYTYEDAIMVLDCYQERGAFRDINSNIRGIHIRFNNFRKDTEISFEQGLELTKEYFPDDIISEHYHKFESFYQDSGNKRNYTVVYELNDGEDKEEYSYWLSVVLCTNETGKMDSLNIYSRRLGDSRVEPEKIEWNYDLLSVENIED